MCSERRDYVADRRQYHAGGRTSGGWMVIIWDRRRSIYVEGPVYPTKREASAVLAQRRRDKREADARYAALRANAQPGANAVPGLRGDE